MTGAASPTAPDAAHSDGPGSVGRWAWLSVLTAVAVTVLGLSLVAGNASYTALGVSDPGLWTHLAAPLLRACADIAATVCVGALVFAVFFTTPDPSGALDSRGYAAVVSAGRWAALWSLAATTLIPVDASDNSGQPLPEVLHNLVHRSVSTNVLGSWAAMETPLAWMVTALLTVVVGLSCRTLTRWPPALASLTVALCALLPALVTGHSSSDRGHDLATAAIMVHVPAAVVWLGTLTALLRQRGRGGICATARAHRYRRLAWYCWLAVLVSGLIDVLVLVPPPELLSRGYGSLVVVKLVCAIVLGIAAALLRRRTRDLFDARTISGTLWWRLAVLELVALAAAGAVSVGLTHLAPPAWLGQPVTIEQTLLGYNLAGPPTALRLLLDWRLDMLFGPAALLLAGVYLLAARRIHQGDGGRWPPARTLSWLAGCGVVLVATSSGIGRYAAAMFSLHIISHMLISMLAPLLLALGAPLSLARAALPADALSSWGPQAWLDTVLNSSLLRLVTHPIVALAAFAGAPFALYFTGLFDAAVRFHWAHLTIDAVFLAIGYVFAWITVGPDALPRPIPHLARLAILLAAMPFDILFGAGLLNDHQMIGNGAAGANMYSALALPWAPTLAADQRSAGLAALGIGELCLLGALTALLRQWHLLEQGPPAAPPCAARASDSEPSRDDHSSPRATTHPRSALHPRSPDQHRPEHSEHRPEHRHEHRHER